MGDQGDRVLAGTAGDDAIIVNYAQKHWPNLHILCPLTDPKAVEIATQIGVGGTFRGNVGGTLSQATQHISGTWQVAHLSEGHFVQKGPYLAGEPAELGATAVLKNGNITILATSFPAFSQDPACFTSNNLQLENYDVIVVKSGFHFKISFAKVGFCVVADTPGLSNYVVGLFPFKQRRPIYPEDNISNPDLSTRLFLKSNIRA